jgi:hypothetical protein
VSEFNIEDFEDLIKNIKVSLDTHGIDEDQHYSLLSEILFNVTAFIDERANTSLHEVADSFIDDCYEKIQSNLNRDYLLADVNIFFGNGNKVETNVLKSNIENKEYYMLELEVALELRDISEIDKVVDIEGRLNKLLRNKKGIVKVDFQPLKDLGSENWISVPLTGSSHGDFSENIEGLFELIKSVAKKWA